MCPGHGPTSRGSQAPPSLQGNVLCYCPALGPSSLSLPPDCPPGLLRKAEAEEAFLQVADPALGRGGLQSRDLEPRPSDPSQHPGPLPRDGALPLTLPSRSQPLRTLEKASSLPHPHPSVPPLPP